MTALPHRRLARLRPALALLLAGGVLPSLALAQGHDGDDHERHRPPLEARSAGGAAARGAAPGRRRPPASGARTLRVGAGQPYATIGEAVAAAAPWDTVRVGPGTFRERLTVRRPLVLVGEGWPQIDGGGRGHVIEAEAPLELRGFIVRNSGTRVDTEDAGLMARGAPARVLGNRFEEVFYGIYLKQAPGSLVRGNAVRGKALALTRRGDGIRLWESPGTEIVGNEVVGTRDVVVFFSDSLRVADNVIRSGRYGLHYMYSNHNRFLRNRFEGNQVGAFLMYSRDIELRENVFAAEGAGGMGLGLKDADGIRASGNLFVGNAIGTHLDNSPTGRDVRNRFRENVWLRNGTAVWLFPSVTGNIFRGNDFLGNDRPAAVPGGAVEAQAARNDWRGNHWSDYVGFDRDGDGAGDAPFVHAKLGDHLLSRHPELEIFHLSPALGLVDVLARFFPLLRPRPVVVDSTPLLRPANLARWAEAPPVAGAAGAGRSGLPSADRPAWPEDASVGRDGDGTARTATTAALWLLAAFGAAGAALGLARLPRPLPGRTS